MKPLLPAPPITFQMEQPLCLFTSKYAMMNVQKSAKWLTMWDNKSEFLAWKMHSNGILVELKSLFSYIFMIYFTKNMLI